MRFRSECAARRAVLYAFLIVFGGVALAVTLAGWVWKARAESLPPSAIRVIDGDTVAIGRVHYRLLGFDTPELRGRANACTDDRANARAAADRLQALVAVGPSDLAEAPCSCRPGTEGSRDCNHGRRCGILTVGGRDVGDILIAEGLARPYAYDWHHPPKPAKWCGR